MLTDAPALRAALEETLGALTASRVHVEGLTRLAGGASQETWQLDLVVTDGDWQGSHPLVLRRQLGGKIFREALDLAREFRVMQAAHVSGVNVPRPYWFIPDLLGKPAALSRRVSGETIGRRIVREQALADARRRLPEQMAHQLAAIHAVDLDAHGLNEILPAPPPGSTPAQWVIAQLYANLDELGEPHPALELGLRWLIRHEPPPGRLTLVHGDFRIGNVLVNAAGLAGVLDWEFAHIGDPYQDLAWSFVRDWRFGMDHLAFGGIAQADDFLVPYERASGTRVDRERVYYWEVAGNVRWAVGMLNQAHRHLSGQEPNLEFASLGRRCAEIEWEILRLIS